MRNYITLNGKNSNEINGLLIQELPPISKPQIRTEVEEIDGRDGDIVTKLGFAAYDKEFTVGLYKDFDINAIIAYFNSEGTVVFSNESDKYYNYQIIDQIDFERLVRYRTATVRMHCQPFKYSNTEGARTLGNKGTASGEGSFITLDNTPEAQFSKIEPKGNTEQDGTPTPDNPQPISVVTGEQTINITGKNLFGELTEYNVSYCSYTLANNILTITPADTTHNPGVGFLLGTPIPSGETVHLSSATPVSSSTQLRNSSNAVVANFANGIDTTRTLSGTADRIVFNWLSTGSTTPFTVDLSTLQIELGSTATTYEPYQAQTLPVNLGKNLFDLKGFLDSKSATYTEASDGTITFTSVGALYSEPFQFSQDDITVSIQGIVSNLTGSNFRVQLINKAGTAVGEISSSTTTRENLSACKIRFNWSNSGTFSLKNIQVERGSTPTSYSAYFTPIELAKIGTYQDRIYKDDGKWYIEKQVGKVVLDGTEDGWGLWGASTTNTLGARVSVITPAIKDSGSYGQGLLLSDYFTETTNNALYATDATGIATTSSNLYFRIAKASLSSSDLAGFKGWLGTHNTTVYYALATPTTTEITNETLIAQLEALYNQAHAYKGRTHVAAIAQGSNAPHIIEAEVQRSSDGNITNNGNIVSKPTLTIYGSGNIGVSLNGYQIFEITLGDEEYITIDTAAMEAYKDTLDNLKNRLVNGDYSKFALRPGSNMIEFSGIVSKCVISKYSRWL